MNANEVKEFIINANNDLTNIITFLDNDFKETIKGIFDAIYPLIKVYDQNKSRVDYLFKIVEQVIEIKPTNELNCILSSIVDLNNKIDNMTLSKRLPIIEPYQRIKKMLDKIEEKSLKELNDGKLNYLEYLVFQGRNISLIKIFLETNSDTIEQRNKEGNDIIEEILQKYLYLNSMDIDNIEYYYSVLFNILNSNKRESILKKKSKYYRMIKNSKQAYKPHIIKFITLLYPDIKIEETELEERYNININFHDAIIKELAKIKINHDNRINYLDQDVFSIDGEDAVCLDDCLCVTDNHDDTYTLYIHIVDVASLVPYHSIINEEARKRVKTLHLKGHGIVLYPEYISHNLASLQEGEVRNVITYSFTLDKDCKVISEFPNISLGVIKNKHQLTYQSADILIRNNNDDNLTKQLNILRKFALERRNSTKNKELYRSYENMIKLEENHESLNVDSSISANIVHESMILVNYMLAKYFKENNLPYIYRKIIMPKDSEIEKQIAKIRSVDDTLIKDKEFMSNLRISYLKSLYCDTPVKHDGLKLECYSHSTSPARRYPDSYCQYLIHDLVIDKNLDNIELWEYRTKELVRHLNDKETENERFAAEYNYLASHKLIKKKN